MFDDREYVHDVRFSEMLVLRVVSKRQLNTWGTTQSYHVNMSTLLEYIQSILTHIEYLRLTALSVS